MGRPWFSGHGAFSPNKKLQDAIGFVLHSALLVPYYSWQRSHAVHHAFTNHITDGETHVPVVISGDGKSEKKGGENEMESSLFFGKILYTYSEKESKFEEISLLILTLFCINVKSILYGLLRKPKFDQ